MKWGHLTKKHTLFYPILAQIRTFKHTVYCTVNTNLYTSHSTQDKEDDMEGILESLRQPLSSTAHVSIARVLAAKSDLLSVERTSAGRERAATKCTVNKVLIGKVISATRTHTHTHTQHVYIYLEAVNLYPVKRSFL